MEKKQQPFLSIYLFALLCFLVPSTILIDS